MFGDIVGTKLGTRENQHLAPVVFVDDVGQQGFLFAAADWVNGLRDALHRGVARCDLDVQWVAQQAVGEVTNFIAEGG